MNHLTNKISNYFGKFASKEFPKFFQTVVNWGYVKLLGLDLSEFKSPSQYKTLNHLFTRELQISRDISNDFISPADGLISEHGIISKNMEALQIKGLSYSIDELLTDKIEKALKHMLRGGHFINIYLSPKDYHHYHAPMDINISRIIHVAGKLYPVNRYFLNKRKNLFIQNERVILECYTKDSKLFYFVLIGALNVGQIILNFEPKLQSNLGGSVTVYEYDNLPLSKGDNIGFFKMGSTVVILSEDNFLQPIIRTNHRVKFGQKIAEIL